MSNPSPGATDITPAYNSAGFMARAFASILAQTHDNYEIITIDDEQTGYFGQQ